jgi:hypothetical protein
MQLYFLNACTASNGLRMRTNVYSKQDLEDEQFVQIMTEGKVRQEVTSIWGY